MLLYCYVAMKDLQQIVRDTPYSYDQARRRVKALLDAGIIKRERDPHARNRWLYDDRALDLLKRLVTVEEMLAPQEALYQLMAEEKGMVLQKQDMSKDQLRAVVEEQERAITRLKEENARLHKKLQQLLELRKGRLPVEASFFQKLRAAARLLIK